MFEIRTATQNDIELFLEIRLEVLQTVFGSIDEDELPIIERETRAYLQGNGNYVTYLAFDGDAFAACGSVCFYRVLPVCHNPTGEKAFVMNMYTRPEFRRRGIGNLILEKLINDAKARGIQTIHLDASDIGEALYSKYGFVSSASEMHLPID